MDGCNEFGAGQPGDVKWDFVPWNSAPSSNFVNSGFDAAFGDSSKFTWYGMGEGGDNIEAYYGEPGFPGDTTFTLPDTTTIATWYVTIKAGSWTVLDDLTDDIIFLFDELTLWDLQEELPSTVENHRASDIFEV